MIAMVLELSLKRQRHLTLVDQWQLLLLVKLVTDIGRQTKPLSQLAQIIGFFFRVESIAIRDIT